MDNCLAADSWISSTHLKIQHGIGPVILASYAAAAAAVGSKLQHTLIQHALFSLPFWYLIVGVAGKKTAFVHLYNLYIYVIMYNQSFFIFHGSLLAVVCLGFRAWAETFIFWTYITSPIRKKSIKRISWCLPLILEHLPAQSKKVLYSVSHGINSNFFAAAWCSAEMLGK